MVPQRKNQLESNPYLARSGYEAAKLTSALHAKWEDAVATQTLKANNCHIWAVHLDQSEKTKIHFGQYLSAFEQEKANRFYNPQEVIRYTVGRSILRILVSQYIDEHPAEVRFKYTENGKPYLEDSALRFSKAESSGFGLMAFSLNNELGIDLEEIKELSGLISLSETLFSEEEQGELYAASPSKRKESFYNAWTRKEAVLKALGTGLSFPPDQLTVSLDGSPDFKLAIQGEGLNPISDWQLRSFSPSAGYQAAIAISADKAGLSFLRLISS